MRSGWFVYVFEIDDGVVYRQHIPSACAQHAQADPSEGSVQCVAVSTSLCPLLYTARSSLATLSEMIAPAVREEVS